MKSRKHVIFYILTALILAFIQEAFFNDMRIFGAKPNLTLAFLCVTAVRMNYMQAAVYSVSTGLFIDIVYGRYIGFYGLLYFYIAVMIVFLTIHIDYADKLWWPAAAAPIPLFIYAIAESFIARLLAVYAGHAEKIYENGFAQHFVYRILPVTFYNYLVIVLISFPVLKILYRKRDGFI